MQCLTRCRTRREIGRAATPLGPPSQSRSRPRIGGSGSHPRTSGSLRWCCSGVFFDAIEQNTVGIAGPMLREQWGGLGGTEIGLLNTATFTAVALGRVLAGALMDRFGRRMLLGLNLLVFAFGSVLCAIAPNYEVLVGARFLVGLGLGGEIATAVIMLAEFFSAKHRGTAVGLINVAAAGLGNMLAPLFGVIVFAVFSGDDGWRWLFGTLVLPALAVVVYRRALPETPPRYLAAQGRITERTRCSTGSRQGSFAVTSHTRSSIWSFRTSGNTHRRPRLAGPNCSARPIDARLSRSRLRSRCRTRRRSRCSH